MNLNGIDIFCAAVAKRSQKERWLMTTEYQSNIRLSAVDSAGGSQCRATTSSGMSLGLTTEYRDWSYSCGREHSHRPDTKKHESKFVSEARTRQQQQQHSSNRSSSSSSRMRILLTACDDEMTMIEELWSSSFLTILFVVQILPYSYL